MDEIFYKNVFSPREYVLEGHQVYSYHPCLRVICDASCRVPETQQHIPPHRVRGKAACGYLFLGIGDEIVEQRAKYLGEFTIDQAEYKAIIFALDKASSFSRGEIEVWLDSQVLVGQLNGFLCLRSELVKPLFDEVKKLEHRFAKVNYFHHSRGSFWARQADKLANEEYSRRQAG